MYEPVVNCCIVQEPFLLLMLLPSDFVHNSGLVLHGSLTDRAHLSRIGTTKLLVFSLMAIVAGSCGFIIILKTKHLQFVVDNLGLIIPMPYGLVGLMHGFGSSEGISKVVFGSLIAYIALYSCQDIDSSRADLQDTFFSFVLVRVRVLTRQTSPFLSVSWRWIATFCTTRLGSRQ